MHARNLYFPESNEALPISPRVPINPEINIFETSFAADKQTEDWTDWMQWDIGAVETDPINPDRKHSFESTHSLSDTSDLFLFSAYPTNNELSFDEAPFEFEETTDPSKVPPPLQMPRGPRRPAQGYSVLTAAEQQTLQAIAMPYRALSAKVEPISPATSNYTMSRSPSPEIKPATRKTKKRKSSVDEDDMPSELQCQSRKRGHNAIEKRYRTNLNDKISCLRRGIPPLWRSTTSDSKSGDEGEDSDNETGEKKSCQKYGKAAILTRALEYIQHLEGTTQSLGDEVEGLKTRVGAFERLAMSGSIVMDNAPPSVRFSTPKQTLLSIQNDFKQIKHKSKAASTAARNTETKSVKRQK